MAAPINLKANTPGGNSHAKSARAQKPHQGQPAPMATKPKVRTDSGKKAGRSNATMRPTVDGVVGNVKDYTAQWMAAHGLSTPQAAKARTRYASEPADHIGVGSVRGKTSSATTKARVRTTYTGRNFRVNRRPKIVSA